MPPFHLCLVWPNIWQWQFHGNTISCIVAGSLWNAFSSTSVCLLLFLPLKLVAHSRVVDVVETKNLTLEETAAIFDGEEATNEILGNGLNAADRNEKHNEDA